MKDRKSLAAATDGTGPYELTEAVPGDHYTYQIRDGYTWGPNGATTAEKGMPDTVVMKVVAERDHRGEPAALRRHQRGPDPRPGRRAPRGAGPVRAPSTPALVGEQWYNHDDGHATSDPAVRMALTQALDLGELASVSTAGAGTPATTLAAIEPVACPGDSVSGVAPGPGRGRGQGRARRPAGAHLPLRQRRGQRRGRRRRARRPAVGGRRRRGDRQGRGRDRAPGRHLRHR